MTQKIRKAIADDKSISVEGRHVKITTQDGKVTLTGAVRSEAERTSIFTKAAEGLRPRDMLIELFRSLCATIGVRTILCVSNEIA